MDKYAQLKIFKHDLRPQVYMYAFMYVDPEKKQVEDNFPAIKKYVENYKKMSTLGPVPKHWLGFNYICSEDYELEINFDTTKMKKIRPHIQL